MNTFYLQHSLTFILVQIYMKLHYKITKT